MWEGFRTVRTLGTEILDWGKGYFWKNKNGRMPENKTGTSGNDACDYVEEKQIKLNKNVEENY